MDTNADHDPFGAEADRLSMRIRMLEARLESLPTKIAFDETFTHESKLTLTLSFHRGQKGWGLWVEYIGEGGTECVTRLSESDLVTKACACKFLPAFLGDMHAEMTRRAELVAGAHAALDKVGELTRKLPGASPPPPIAAPAPAATSPAQSVQGPTPRATVRPVPPPPPKAKEGGRW